MAVAQSKSPTIFKQIFGLEVASSEIFAASLTGVSGDGSILPRLSTFGRVARVMQLLLATNEHVV